MVRPVLIGIVVGAFAGTLAVSSAAKDKDDKKDVVGTIWHCEISKGKQSKGGQFRVKNDVIYNGDKRVGSVHPKADDQTHLVFNGHRDFDGKASLHRVKRSPPVWEGTLHKDDGTDWHMKLTIKDR